jgi:tetratricopeptide (TPR) repeat protein
MNKHIAIFIVLAVCFVSPAQSLTSADHFKSGVIKEKSGDFEGAIKDFYIVIEQEPDNLDVYEHLGMSKCMLGDYAGAIEASDRALSLYPDNTNALYYKGIAEYRLYDFKSAISDLNKVIAKDPRRAVAYFYRGCAENELFTNEGNVAAVKDYSKAIELGFNDAEVYKRRGREKLWHGKRTEALNDYNKVIELDPWEDEAYDQRGDTKLGLNDEKGAMKDYNKAVELDPDNAHYYFDRGVLEFDFGMANEALKDFSSAISTGYSDKYVYYLRGETNIFLERYDDAIEDFNVCGGYYDERVRAKVLSGDYNGALKDCDHLIEYDGNGYLIRGLVYADKGDKAHALQDCEVAAKKQVYNATKFMNEIKSNKVSFFSSRETVDRLINKE